jgi:hypothetical protein
MMFGTMIYMVYNLENNKQSYGYVCNECLAVYLASDSFDDHTDKMGHSKEAIRLDLLSYSKVSDNKVIALFSLPGEL